MRRLAIVLLLIITLTLGTSLHVFAQDAAADSGQVVHVVQRGETLFRISLRYGVSVPAIASANSIANVNLIYAGQRLVIPTAGSAPVTPPPTTGGGTETVYIVQPGDWLSRIAPRFGTTAAAIAQRNGITNVNLIFVGQRLIIPTGSGVVVQPTPPPSGGGTTPPPTTGGGLTGFALGGHVSSFNNPQAMRDAGMTWVKRQVRFNLGDDPNGVAGVIQQAKDNGFRVMLGVLGDKNQLAQNPAEYYSQFANYLAGVARLNPDAIEVWNEPNIDREWPNGMISGGNYTQMLSAAYRAIKAANPNVTVISGAPAPTGFFGGTCQAGGCDDNIFIRQMRDAGAANFMDCVGIHYNEGILPPSARSGDPRGNSSHYTRYYPTMVEVYSGTFPSKPLCFTELGYLTGEGLGALPPGWEWASQTTIAQQAQWLGDAVRLARQSGRVRLLIVWNVDFTTYNADPQAGYAIIRGGNCTACGSLRAAMQ